MPLINQLNPLTGEEVNTNPTIIDAIPEGAISIHIDTWNMSSYTLIYTVPEGKTLYFTGHGVSHYSGQSSQGNRLPVYSSEYRTGGAWWALAGDKLYANNAGNVFGILY
tara:strand:- start:1840 stop:2166 length:327 start_codon:yes stop_codon:yes gene_type:complete